MAEPAGLARGSAGWRQVVTKRWRAWLRAVHRDLGYLAIGFTVIYAVSGIAQNHIEEWGDVSYRTYEETRAVPAVTAEASDEAAVAQIAALVGLGAPSGSLRTGDELRLDYANGSKVTVIGTQATIQRRERRGFIGAANWLHTARQKHGWKYVADAYAVFLLYLAISGIFMIKGKLGLRWRGTALIGIGVIVPVAAVTLSGPDAQRRAQDARARAAEPTSGSPDAPPGRPFASDAAPRPSGGPPAIPPTRDDAPPPTAPVEDPRTRPAPGTAPLGRDAGAQAAPPEAAAAPASEGSGIRFLPPEENPPE